MQAMKEVNEGRTRKRNGAASSLHNLDVQKSGPRPPNHRLLCSSNASSVLLLRCGCNASIHSRWKSFCSATSWTMYFLSSTGRSLMERGGRGSDSGGEGIERRGAGGGTGTGMTEGVKRSDTVMRVLRRLERM